MRAGPWTGRYLSGAGPSVAGPVKGQGLVGEGLMGRGRGRNGTSWGRGRGRSGTSRRQVGRGRGLQGLGRLSARGRSAWSMELGRGVQWTGWGAALPRDKGRRRRETDLEGADLEGRGPPDRGGTSATRETWRVLLWPWTSCAVGPYPLPHRVLSRAHPAPPVPGGALRLPPRPASRGPRPLLSTAFSDLDDHQTAFHQEIALFLRKGVWCPPRITAAP